MYKLKTEVSEPKSQKVALLPLRLAGWKYMRGVCINSGDTPVGAGGEANLSKYYIPLY